MTAIYHPEVEQGSDEWYALRVGLLTASEMKLIVSPPPEIEKRIKKNGEPYKQREWDPVALNDKERAHMYELLAQRINNYTEPHYVGDDMLRGHADEIKARELYHERNAPVKECGFITNDKWGFTIGYSPDGLIGRKGLLECKSRRQKYQVQTIIEHHTEGNIPADYLMQVQTGLLVADDRQWLDLCSYTGGMPMRVMRVWPDDKIQDAIITAAGEFERRLAEKMDIYMDAISGEVGGNYPTIREVEQEMYV